MVFGGIMLGFALLAYWQSLLPAGCVLCPPREYGGAIFFFTVVGIIFVAIGALVKYADWEQKKAYGNVREWDRINMFTSAKID